MLIQTTCLRKLGLSFKDDYEKNLEFQKVRTVHFHLSSDLILTFFARFGTHFIIFGCDCNL